MIDTDDGTITIVEYDTVEEEFKTELGVVKKDNFVITGTDVPTIIEKDVR